MDGKLKWKKKENKIIKNMQIQKKEKEKKNIN